MMEKRKAETEVVVPVLVATDDKNGTGASSMLPARVSILARTLEAKRPMCMIKWQVEDVVEVSEVGGKVGEKC